MAENYVPTPIPTAPMSPTLSTQHFSTQNVCANCKHWKDQFCHRHPPVVVSTEEGVVTRFPHTNPGDWCGDHQFEQRVQDQFVVKQTYNLP